MKACTFFGHRNSPDNIEPLVYKTTEKLITTEFVEKFYVGNQGNFDNIVHIVLNKLKQKYTHIRCYIVLAYFPNADNTVYSLPTIYPEGIEKISPKYAVFYRNKWMIDNSQIAVTYITHSIGGASKFSDMAEKKGLTVINIKNT